MKKDKPEIKLVKDKKVIPLRERPATVNNIIRDAATNQYSYTKVMLLAVTKDNELHASWSKMKPSERIFLADFAKHIALQDIE